ncbi:glycosyltransferase family 2 protein [Patescibacteria group bacterium]|nr:glycosyltransferase family 2 protein [Patescibacteria group bacterium]MBU2219969.1 glycosyltransferase family 2 protein [Patescibacteria group bacterium]MBU2264847.1 glycosyltransferase family 2 protein [Patescibacteria group bacterium]
MEKSEYIKISNARDIKDAKERRIYRLFEILPGLLSWGTLLGVVFLSWLAPVFIAFFIIAFDIYWLLKTVFLSVHLRSSFAVIKKISQRNWLAALEEQNKKQDLSWPASAQPSHKATDWRGKATVGWQEIYHLVIFPMYEESYEVVAETFESLLSTNYPKEKMIVVLAVEKRAGERARAVAGKIEKYFGGKFFNFLTVVHPNDIVGELAGKGSNETWAAKEAKEKIIDRLNLPYENIVVSVFDVDTVVYREYFGRLTHVFLEAPDRLHCSFQPVPIFNNNIWDAPSFSRVAAQSGTFWHMMQQERPERLATFSSHAMNFKTLVEMDWWSVKNVSEDSRIFWQALLFYDAKYRVVPLFYPVSMDANLAENWWQTAVNVYKQQRRWGWGVENVPYVLFGFRHNKNISLKTKIFWMFNHMEGFWSWGTNALLIFLLGWLPLFLGGQQFNVTVLSYNLPQVTRAIMTAAMIGIVSSAIYGARLLPPRPKHHQPRRYFFMAMQWILMPFTIIVFGAIPGLEAQTRLMLGKYMGFWVTPKVRQTKS